MASLKEVKNRIFSVQSTRKITSAMKMVASSKLHRAQQAIENLRPYEAALSSIMSRIATGDDDALSSPFAQQRIVKCVAIVAFTSNSSLCGAFNANVVKSVKRLVSDLQQAGKEVTTIYCVGRKVSETKWDTSSTIDASSLLDDPQAQRTADIAQAIMQQFLNGDIDACYLVYHHFKSSAVQQLTTAQFLPIRQQQDTTARTSSLCANYIVEPHAQTVLDSLVPATLELQLHAALLDSLASEHAARMIAMQVATDNADELLRQLRLQYNKTRQAAITAELLDIVGGSMA